MAHMSWDAARAASRRELPKPRKMHGPVGEVPPPNGELRAAWDENDQPFAIACKKCGHDVCDCKPVKRNRYMFPVMVGVETGQVATSTCFSLSDPAECRSDAPADPRPGSVDVAGLENLRAEWQRDRDEMCTCGCGYSKTTCNYVRYHEAAFKAMSSPNSVVLGDKDREQRPCGLCLSSEHKSLQCPEMARLYRERLGPL